MSSAVTLRDYQEEGYADLQQGLLAGHIRQVLSLSTGGGKTAIAVRLMESVRDKGGRVCFIVDRVPLVEQVSESLMEYGILHGIAQGENTMGRLLPIQICSAQTLERRGTFPDCELVIYDEAHTRRQKILQALMNRGIPVVGLTATPFANGMSDFYSRVVNVRTTNSLIEDGWLSPIRVHYGTQADMTKAATNNMGEWLDSEVEKRTIPIVGNVVTEWIRMTNRTFGKPVKTLVYTSTVAAGTELCRQFQSAGFRFEQISYLDRNDDQRKRKIREFRQGNVMGLVSCEALIKGADFPFVQCLVDVRPYRTSYMAHIQKLGRLMRICPEIGKKFGLLLDHVGNYLRHAEVTEQFWAEGCLALSDEANDERKQRVLQKTKTDRKCPCGFVLESASQVCPMCGRQRQRRETKIVNKPGQMVEHKTLDQEIGDLWPHISAYAMEKKKKEGMDAVETMARRLYKDLTQSWPKWGRELELTGVCDPRVRERIVRKQRQKYVVRTKMRSKGRG